MRNASCLRRLAWCFFAMSAALVFCNAGYAFAADPSTRLARAAHDLGESDYVLREAAQAILWRAGRTAVPLLREAAASDRPELASSAKAILSKIEVGILPDTPHDVAAAIIEYRCGSDSVKAALLPSLARSLQATPRCKSALGRLWMDERDAAHREEIWKCIRRSYADCPLEMIADGDEDGAAAVFRQLATDDSNYPSARYAAAYFLKTGRLDIEIARVEQEFLVAPTRPLALFLSEAYRMRGDLDRALRIARPWATAYDLACLAEERGDYADAVKSIEAMPATGMYPWARLIWAASLYRVAGDQPRCDQKLDAIATGDLNIDVALSGYLLNDRPTEGMRRILGGALNRGPNHDESAAIKLLCYQWRFREAIERSSKPAAQSSDVLLTLASRLYAFGARDEGLRLVEQLHAGARARTDRELYVKIIKTLREMGLEDRAVATSMEALEIPGNGLELGELTKLLFPEYGESSERFWRLMLQLYPTARPEERVGRLKSFFQGDSTIKEAQAIVGEAMHVPRLMFGENRWNSDLIRFTLRYGLEESHLQDLAESGEGAECLTVLGDEHAAKGHWERAATAYGEAWERSRKYRFGDPVLLFLQGHALEKAGNVDEGREITARAHRMCINGDYYYSGLLSRLEERGLKEDAAQERELICRVAPINEPAIGRVVTEQAVLIAPTNPLEAARLWDARLLHMCNDCTYFPDPSFYLEVPRQIHHWRAEGLERMQDNDGELHEWEMCLAYQPFDIDAAVGEMKILQKRHRAKDADAIYSQTRGALEALCEEFPESGMAHNALGWLAVQSGRDPDLAFRHATQGSKLDPDNAAYLDTLAQVYRSRGDQSAALKLMRRCVELDPKSAVFKARLSELELSTLKRSYSPASRDKK